MVQLIRLNVTLLAKLLLIFNNDSLLNLVHICFIKKPAYNFQTIYLDHQKGKNSGSHI